MAHRQAQTYEKIRLRITVKEGRKMKKRIFAILMIVGFVFLLGTVGAADCEQISLTELLIRSIAGFILIGGGYIGLSMC